LRQCSRVYALVVDALTALKFSDFHKKLLQLSNSTLVFKFEKFHTKNCPSIQKFTNAAAVRK
jgi:hypothetical protein